MLLLLILLQFTVLGKFTYKPELIYSKFVRIWNGMWFEDTNSWEIFVGNLDYIEGAAKISLELVQKSAWPTYSIQYF